MEDREFFDTLYQLWAGTSWAADGYWKCEEDPGPVLRRGVRSSLWFVQAVNAEDETFSIASGMAEADADYVTAIHVCLPDLVRRLHSALDESERLDTELDVYQGRLAAAEMRVDELTGGTDAPTD